MLDAAEALGSTAEILEAHSIPHVVSKDMRALGLGMSFLPAAAPADSAQPGSPTIIDIAAKAASSA